MYYEVTTPHQDATGQPPYSEPGYNGQYRAGQDNRHPDNDG